MGGTAYVIYGEISIERFQTTPIPRNLIDRLLARQRYALPTASRCGRGLMRDLPCRELAVIRKEFLQYLADRFPKPSSHDESMLAYLREDVMDMFVREERGIQKGQDGWYVQIGFSGCAGVCETSAALAFHWFGIWYSENALRIAEKILIPYGFTPNAVQKNDAPDLFIPLDGLGYASYMWISRKRSLRDFDIDDILAQDHDTEGILEHLRQDYSGVLADEQCRCSLCMPDFLPVKIRV